MANLQSINISDDGFLGLPRGTTSQRPSSPEIGYLRFNVESNLIEFYEGSRWLPIDYPVPAVITSSDSIVSTSNGYTVHRFESNGNFEIVTPGEIEYLVVGGGGGGASRHGGGGGAGGVQQGKIYAPPGIYSVRVGAGGAGAPAGSSTRGSRGSESCITFPFIDDLELILGEGGGFGTSGQEQGGAGASGGGGRGNTDFQGGDGFVGMGFKGGDGSRASPLQGGGGGGAGGPGREGGTADDGGPLSGQGGDGGRGLYSPITGQYYGGGGGGGNDTTRGLGGLGGGGNGGGADGGDNSTAGAQFSGGGGGAGGQDGGNRPGKPGGSGLVIVRHLA